jgi:hypothetical protein
VDDISVRVIVEYGSAIATAVCALTAAFRLNGSRRGRGWLIASLVSLAVWLWLGAVGLACAETVRQGRSGTWSEAVECFGFLIAAGAIIALLVVTPLYRRRPRAKVSVAAMAGLGVAAAASSILQFTHDFPPTLVDVAAHTAAISLLIASVMWSRRLVPPQI